MTTKITDPTTNKDIEAIGEIVRRGSNVVGYINEIVASAEVDGEEMIIARYYNELMVLNGGVLYQNPLVKLVKNEKGSWRAYFLDQKWEDIDYPIFENKGYKYEVLIY